jgi:hypothetical protein
MNPIHPCFRCENKELKTNLDDFWGITDNSYSNYMDGFLKPEIELKWRDHYYTKYKETSINPLKWDQIYFDMADNVSKYYRHTPGNFERDQLKITE